MQPQQKLEAKILDYPLTAGQLRIVGCVLDEQVQRLIISCMTRYGKTRVVAIALLLYILEHQNKKILIIAPTIDQTNIIRNYISEMIANNTTLCNLVDQPTHSGPEHLKSEMSKKRLTFKNGCELITLTAHGEENSKDPGKQLMGFGGDIVVLDEACLIMDEVYTSRISRMLGDSPDSKLITIVNPWKITNFAFKQWQNPLFKKVHVDWKQALDEGRITETYLKEQKELLSDYEWTVLYESKWSTESEDTLIRYDWIQRAIQRGKEDNLSFTISPRRIHGLDVAEQGADLTILTTAETDGFSYKIINQQHIRERETIPTANAVASIIPLKEEVNVDSIGVGAGVYSQLKELGYNVNSVRVGESPSNVSDVKRYMNLKSQRWWQLREVFEHDQISIINPHPKLISQLSQMRYEFTPLSKIKIIDPPGKSPDYADSLMLTLLTKKIVPNPSFVLY
jgi:hypothetical protein